VFECGCASADSNKRRLNDLGIHCPSKTASPTTGVRRMCHTVQAGMRQYGLFRYFNKVLPCGLGWG
jgi:hypothetical protein